MESKRVVELINDNWEFTIHIEENGNIVHIQYRKDSAPYIRIDHNGVHVKNGEQELPEGLIRFLKVLEDRYLESGNKSNKYPHFVALTAYTLARHLGFGLDAAPPIYKMID